MKIDAISVKDTLKNRTTINFTLKGIAQFKIRLFLQNF